MSDTTPRLGLPTLPPTPVQPHVTHNEALLQLDALVFARFLDRDLTAPPASPADGDTYLVHATGAGDWTGQDGQIAYAVDGGWRFVVPFTGLAALVVDEARLVVFTGAAWVDYASILNLQNVPLLGVNTTADATNKLAAKSSAILFDNVGGGVQAKLNKHASGDTASLLYQTNYSGRAELGLAGDDHLHVKVSPDGSAWQDALTVRADTGRIGINTTNPGSLLELHVDGSVPDASWYSADDLVIVKESNGIGLSGFVASTANKRMVFGGRRARGTLAAPAAVASGDWTFSLLGSGYDGAAQRSTAAITFGVDGIVASGALPQRITFETGTGATRAERVRINATGELGVGKTATAGILLDVNGPVGVASYTVAALPSPAQAGQIVYVGNESGGAVLAFSDGANWRRVTDRAVVS
ncbi:MAG: DUF2793 domain-containing protein [Rhizomicrobium sp.]